MRAKRLGSAGLAAAALIQLSVWVGPVSGVRPTLVGRAGTTSSAPVERWYVAIPGGDEERLLSIFRSLSAAGARNMHVFLPDLVICDAPLDVDPYSIATAAGAEAARAEDVARLDVMGLSLSPAKIEHVRREGIAAPHPTSPDATEASPRPLGEPRRLPEAAMRESARRAGALDLDERLIHQNSEILAGTILINVILPESDYPTYLSQYENWSEDDIAQIKLGLYYVIQNYQQNFDNAGIDVIYKVRDPVLIKAEPIRFTSARQNYWLTLTMNSLTYFGPESDILQTVHEYNEDQRQRIGADWTFTMFLASARLAPDHLFPEARVLSWSYVGGPYFVSSYPAGHLDGAWGMQLLIEHEMGHMFWGLEENNVPLTSCTSRSGYLDVVNANKVTKWQFILGAWWREGCPDVPPPVACTMNQFDMFALGGGVVPCKFSQQMFGVSDQNDNLVPDAFDRPPAIEFATADIETIATPVESMTVRVVAQAIPNANPLQPPDLRRNYAAAIRDIDVAVGGTAAYTIKPDQIDSDGYEADFVINLPSLLPGNLNVEVQARNIYDARSAPRVKTYMYVDLAYSGFVISHPNEGIALEWGLLGTTFDASMKVFRQNLSTEEEIVIADGVAPSGPPRSGVTPFRLIDDDVEIGVEYQYRVRGTIDLPYRGGLLHKEVESRSVKARAAVPRNTSPTSPVSRASPNPFRDRTWLSLSIPRVDEITGGNPDEDLGYRLSTQVRVDAYDVLGRHVKRLFSGRVIGDAVTVSWDGTSDTGRQLPSGVYFLRASVGNEMAVRKVLLVR